MLIPPPFLWLRTADANSSSERQYRRLVSQMKPGVKGSGEKQRDASGSTRAASSSSALAVRPESSTQGQMVRKNDLYPDASNLSYGTHRPDDAALDRVSAHLNSECVAAVRAAMGEGKDDANAMYLTSCLQTLILNQGRSSDKVQPEACRRRRRRRDLYQRQEQALQQEDRKIFRQVHHGDPRELCVDCFVQTRTKCFVEGRHADLFLLTARVPFSAILLVVVERGTA